MTNVYSEKRMDASCEATCQMPYHICHLLHPYLIDEETEVMKVKQITQSRTIISGGLDPKSV